MGVKASSKVTLSPALIAAAHSWSREYSKGHLARRLGVTAPRLSLLLHQPLPATAHNRALAAKLARVVGVDPNAPLREVA